MAEVMPELARTISLGAHPDRVEGLRSKPESAAGKGYEEGNEDSYKVKSMKCHTKNDTEFR